MQNQFSVGKGFKHSPILQRPKCRKKKNGKQGDTLLTVFLQLPKCANYFFKITNDFAATVVGSALSVGVPLETSTAFV